MTTIDVIIRPATPEDVPAVNIIHKHYVLNTVLTFSTEPSTDDAALGNHNKVKDEGLPYIVAIDESTQSIVGYAYVSSFRGPKPGYRHTLELSLFCDPSHIRKGIGAKLLERLTGVLKDPEQWDGYFEGQRLLEHRPKQLMAVMAVDIDMPGQGWKLRDWYVLHGFVQRAHLKEVGWKKERWIDTVYLQLQLRD